MGLLSQIVVGICFLVLIIVLFFDQADYLFYSVLLIMIAGGISMLDNIEESHKLENYVDAIDWEVIFFLIAMFAIVEILNEAKIFHTVAKAIVKKFSGNIRLMFYIICIVSTLTASIMEDLSVAIIFIPIIILACQELKINPTPFLLGMTICINIASTLTPFGSAENIMIANRFNLTTLFFVKNLGIYFVVTTALSLFLLDQFVLKKYISDEWRASCSDKHNIEEMEELDEFQSDKITLQKNLIGMGLFIAFLLFIYEIHIAGILGMLVFVAVNGEKGKKAFYRPQLSNYLRKVDYKLIYFFMCLFVLVFLMEANGTVLILETFLLNLSHNNIFEMAIIILITTSLLSGFLDNAPVTIIFIPIIDILITSVGFNMIPLMIAFVLGINLGGNFLPQGSAADMMTLELSQQHCVDDLTYKKLTKVGGLFALLHIILGIGYLALYIYVF